MKFFGLAKFCLNFLLLEKYLVTDWRRSKNEPGLKIFFPGMTKKMPGP